MAAQWPHLGDAMDAHSASAESLKDIYTQSMADLNMALMQRSMERSGSDDSQGDADGCGYIQQQAVEPWRRSSSLMAFTASESPTFTECMDADPAFPRAQRSMVEEAPWNTSPQSTSYEGHEGGLFPTDGGYRSSDAVPCPHKSSLFRPREATPESSPLFTRSATNNTDSSARDTRVLVQAAHCPAWLQRESWSVHQFELEKVLYAGAISRVLRAVDVSMGATMVLKVYKRSGLSDVEKYQVAREIRTHSKLEHKHVIGMYAAWKDKRFIHMLMEWAPHGDLMSHMQSTAHSMEEDTVVMKIMRPLLSALAYVHKKGLIHRNVHPSNILLGLNYCVKLADFSLSIDNDAEIANTLLGQMDYTPPEVLRCTRKHHPLDNKNGAGSGYDNKVDIWSIGVLAHELLTRELPFQSSSLQGTLQRILRGEPTLAPGLDRLAAHFIVVCLQKDPAARPSAQDLLQHPWIAGSCSGIA